MAASLINLRYQVLNELGEGGFGTTFLAKDIQMPSRRRCVIKQLKPMSDRPEVFAVVRQRFDREATVLESVGKGHSQIPDLYAYFEEDGKFYLVQEWIDGQPLSDLAASPWSEEQVCTLLSHTLSALTHVHGLGLIHRDIKPDNIILRQADQLPCLIDFGAVKELMNTLTVNDPSSLAIGTPGYMPAEQAIGRPTFSSDLYSLGMTAIFLLTGRSPAQIPTDSRTGEVLWQQFAPDVSPAFAAVITKAVQPTAQNRYSTADEMQSAIPSQSTKAVSIFPTVISSKPFEMTSQPPQRLGVIAQNPPVQNTPIQEPATQLSATRHHAHQHTQQQSKTVVPFTQNPSKLNAIPLKRVSIAAGALLLGAGIVFAGLNARGLSPELKEAQAALEVGDYDQALTQLDEVLSESPDSVTALIMQGKAQKRQGDYSGAEESFSEAIALDDRSTEALNLRGDTRWAIGKYDEAQADYRNVLRINPDDGESYKDLAFVNEERGQTQEAINNLNIAIEKDAELASAYFFRGSLRADQNDKEGAVEDWEKVVSIPAETAENYLTRSQAKSRLNDKDGALSDTDQALIINPNYEPAILARAFILLDQGEVEQSLNAVDKALSVNPNSVQAMLIQGLFASLDPTTGPQESIDIHTRALEVNPNNTGVLSGRCVAYTAAEQLDLALADCNKAIQINPNFSDVYINRGNIYSKQDNLSAAIKDYTRNIEIWTEMGNEPAAASGYANRSGILIRTGDVQGAFSDIDKAVELSPQTPSYYTSRGMLQSIQGDKDAARTDMQKAADMYLENGDTPNRDNVLYLMEQFEL